MSAWVVEDWTFWIWDARCDECNAYLKESKPVMHPAGGVAAVSGKCFRHGDVETGRFEIGDLTG